MGAGISWVEGCVADCGGDAGETEDFEGMFLMELGQVEGAESVRVRCTFSYQSSKEETLSWSGETIFDETHSMPALEVILKASAISVWSLVVF